MPGSGVVGMSRWDELDRYVIITSDAHGGAAMADYKPYLDRRWHDEFDAWLAGVTMPWVDVTDTSNWDSDVRVSGRSFIYGSARPMPGRR